MRILIEGPVYDPSGLGKIARKLALHLRYVSLVRIKPLSYWGAKPIKVYEYKILKKLETTILHGKYFHIQVLPFKSLYNNPYATTIGLGLFEIDRVPKVWPSIASRLSAIWTTSQFNHDTFKNSGVKNKLVPFCGVDLMDYRPKTTPLEIPPKRKFNFISNFEWTPRKGWLTLLSAYWKEFNREEKVSLTIKTYFGAKINRKFIISQIQQLRKYIGVKEIPTTILCTDMIPEPQMPNFYASGDCYVSSSWGDGFNLPSLEASACGLPVIANGWGGDTSYLPKENLIDSKVENIDSFDQIELCVDMLGGRWARPSMENLRHLLRRAFENKLKPGDKNKLIKYRWHDIAGNIKRELLKMGEENGKK